MITPFEVYWNCNSVVIQFRKLHNIITSKKDSSALHAKRERIVLQDLNPLILWLSGLSYWLYSQVKNIYIVKVQPKLCLHLPGFSVPSPGK